MKFYIYLIAIIATFPAFAHAADPSVQYLNPSASSINSNQVVSFTWNTTNSGGYSFMIPCVQGIKLFKADGSTFSCDTTTSSTLSAQGGIDIMVRNLNGSARAITFRLTPKDATGADFTWARQEASVTIAPVATPIDSLDGALSVKSMNGYTLSWTASQLDGVNLSISCSSIIRTTSSSYSNGYLPCGTPVFTNDLSPSSSLILFFENNTTATSTITLSILPAMAPHTYNGAGARSITIDVVPNITPDPSVTSFSINPDSLRIADNTPVTLSWITDQADGANLWFSCNDNITPVITIGNATSTPPCNALAFDTALSTSGSISVFFSNKSYTTEPITITLLPKSKKGGFDGTRSKQLPLAILTKGATLPSPLVVAATQPTPTSAPQTTASTFTKYLYRGVSGSEVSALQEILKKDASVYPEGLITGYFGYATERAVKRLQIKYGLGNTGTPGFGGVGPKTRALLNSLIK